MSKYFSIGILTFIRERKKDYRREEDLSEDWFAVEMFGSEPAKILPPFRKLHLPEVQPISRENDDGWGKRRTFHSLNLSMTTKRRLPVRQKYRHSISW